MNKSVGVVNTSMKTRDARSTWVGTAERDICILGYEVMRTWTMGVSGTQWK